MKWREGHRSCRDECRMSCKKCDKLRSEAEHPKAMQVQQYHKGYKQPSLLLLHCFGTSACRIGIRNTLLPCSVGLWKGILLLFHTKYSVMENPFELIIEKLNSIENLLKTLMKNDNGTVTITEVLNLNQAAEYVSLSKSAIYKKTSERNIPHFKKGKKLYFKRRELDNWLTSMKISTKDEIDQAGTDYIIKKGNSNGEIKI